MAGPFEQRRERVSQGGPAPVADVQRSRRVRRHELDVHPQTAADIAAPEARATGEHVLHHARELRLGEEKIDEARARDLDPFHEPGGQLQGLHQLLRHVARPLAEHLGEHQRQVRRHVPVGGVPRCFELELRRGRRTQPPRRTNQGVAQQRMRLHLSPESFFLGVSEALGSVDLDSEGFASPSFFSGLSLAFL